MLTAINRRLRNPRGQAMVELALVLPLVLLVLFGIMEFGLVFQAYLTVNHVAREGARLAAVGGTNAAINSLITANAAGLTLADLTVTITPSSEASRTAGTMVTVRVDYRFRLIVPLISDITGATIPMAAALSMRIE